MCTRSIFPLRFKGEPVPRGERDSLYSRRQLVAALLAEPEAETAWQFICLWKAFPLREQVGEGDGVAPRYALHRA